MKPFEFSFFPSSRRGALPPVALKGNIMKNIMRHAKKNEPADLNAGLRVSIDKHHRFDFLGCGMAELEKSAVLKKALEEIREKAKKTANSVFYPVFVWDVIKAKDGEALALQFLTRYPMLAGLVGKGKSWEDELNAIEAVLKIASTPYAIDREQHMALVVRECHFAVWSRSVAFLGRKA